jgi:hypothetical protein
MFSEEDEKFIGTYDFMALDTLVCDPTDYCTGFQISGEYVVTTNEFGEHTLDMKAQVFVPSGYNLNAMIGVGWAVGYGENESKTESYLALWTYQQAVNQNDWVNMTLSGPNSLDEVR